MPTSFSGRDAHAKSISLSYAGEEPNEASLGAIREAEEIFANEGGRRFKTAEELFASLEV